jgi:hypothetical protein
MKDTFLVNDVTSIVTYDVSAHGVSLLFGSGGFRPASISTTCAKLRRRSMESINMLVATMNTHNTDMLLTAYDVYAVQSEI